MVSQSGRCITSYAYYSNVSEYFYEEDQIVTINSFLPFPKTDKTFYLPELDSVVFIDNQQQKAFGTWQMTTNEIKNYGEEDSKFLKNIWLIEGAQSVTAAPQKLTDSFVSIEGTPFDQRAYMFGTWQSPFMLNINFKDGEESVKVERIAESLFLKFEQGVEILDDSRLIFAGGYADDYSIFATSDVMIYDVDTKLLKECNDLKTENLAVLLKKIDLKNFEFMREKVGFFGELMGRKPKPVSLANPGVYDVFLVNDQDEFEIWNSQTQDWNLTPKIGAQDFPIFLDVKDRLIIFSSFKDKKDKPAINWIAFREYDFQSKLFKVIYSQKAPYVLSLNFSHRIADNVFLVAVSKDNKKYFAKMTLVWNNQDISEVKFDLLEALDELSILGEYLRYFVMGRDLFVVLVLKGWKVQYKTFNLDKLAFVDSPKAKKIGQMIEQSLHSIGLENTADVRNFNLVSKK